MGCGVAVENPCDSRKVALSPSLLPFAVPRSHGTDADIRDAQKNQRRHPHFVGLFRRRRQDSSARSPVINCGPLPPSSPRLSPSPNTRRERTSLLLLMPPWPLYLLLFTFKSKTFQVFALVGLSFHNIQAQESGEDLEKLADNFFKIPL